MGATDSSRVVSAGQFISAVPLQFVPVRELGFAAWETVSPAARGRGVGCALVEAVALLARERACSVLHWRTRESNASAHALYSQFAQRTEFISYRLAL